MELMLLSILAVFAVLAFGPGDDDDDDDDGDEDIDTSPRRFAASTY